MFRVAGDARYTGDRESLLDKINRARRKPVESLKRRAAPKPAESEYIHEIRCFVNEVWPSLFADLELHQESAESVAEAPDSSFGRTGFEWRSRFHVRDCDRTLNTEPI